MYCVFLVLNGGQIVIAGSCHFFHWQNANSHYMKLSRKASQFLVVLTDESYCPFFWECINIDVRNHYITRIFVPKLIWIHVRPWISKLNIVWSQKQNLFLSFNYLNIAEILTFVKKLFIYLSPNRVHKTMGLLKLLTQK